MVERVRAAKQDNNLLVWGSPSLVQSLMAEGLVDEYVLLYSPIVRHQGIRLFSDEARRTSCKSPRPPLLSGGMLALRMSPRAK